MKVMRGTGTENNANYYPKVPRFSGYFYSLTLLSSGGPGQHPMGWWPARDLRNIVLVGDLKYGDPLWPGMPQIRCSLGNIKYGVPG